MSGSFPQVGAAVHFDGVRFPEEGQRLARTKFTGAREGANVLG